MKVRMSGKYHGRLPSIECLFFSSYLTVVGFINATYILRQSFNLWCVNLIVLERIHKHSIGMSIDKISDDHEDYDGQQMN